MSIPIVHLAPVTERDVVQARQRARETAAELGLDNQDRIRIATATSEIAGNAFRYARNGKVTFSPNLDPRQRIEVTGSDTGPGIANEQQNRELLTTLQELRARQGDLELSNRELEDTNRGILALHAELDERADYLRRASDLKPKFLGNRRVPWPMRMGLFLALALTPAVAQKARPHPEGAPPSNAQLASPEIERRVDALLARMTLEEKLGQLVQYNTAGAASATVPAGRQAELGQNPEANYHLDPMQLAQTGRLGSMLNVADSATISAYQHAAVEKSRLHIPLLFGADVIHGYRTIYPVPLGLAASFDPDVVTAVARMAAEEASTAGIRWFYSPMVDISRDARWGRSVEGAGEDAYLGSAMARAYVRGYQTDTLSKPDSVAATVKHFAAYGAAEAGREYNTTDMSESRLRQVYLPPYKAAVEAGAATVMSSFNALNGVPGTANRYLLDRVLRKEWGFNGFVISDYTAIMELMHHGVALDAATAAEKAFHAGVDVDMMSHLYDTELPGLIKAGRVPMAEMDESVRRVLRVKFALGLFEHPYPMQPEVSSIAPERGELAQRAAEESFVLLENKQLHRPRCCRCPQIPKSR